jgi:hypothetical protein
MFKFNSNIKFLRHRITKNFENELFKLNKKHDLNKPFFIRYLSDNYNLIGVTNELDDINYTYEKF